MTPRLKLRIGDSVPSLAAQLSDQGLEINDGGLHQRLMTALTVLATHRILTRAEAKAARQRLEERVKREARAVR